MKIKKKLLLFLAGLISFVALFYYREPGVNVFIFCTVAWFLVVYSQGGFTPYKSRPGFWVLSLAVVIAAGSYTYYGDPGSMLCIFLSFYILGIYLTDRRFHIIIYPLLLAYSFATFIVRIFFIERWIPLRKPSPGEQENDNRGGVPQITPKSSDPKHPWVRVWLIPLMIAALFVVVYMASSSMFADVLTRLLPNLDFPVLLALTALGFFLLFNFMYLLPIKWLYEINTKIAAWDKGLQKMKSQNDPRREASHQKAAVITLSLVSGLLMLFLLVYGYELYHGIHQDRLSAALHEQVNSIILSVVMAVAVILYYIRPVDNSSGTAATNPSLLHKMAYCWIILNSVLVISACLHNAAYVQRYGLTLLRVGVYIFLILCLIGLYFTYRKIKDRRSPGYLISIMLKIFFGTIIINSTINWSVIITRYNLTHMEKPDLRYLKTLDYNKYELYLYLIKDPKQQEFRKWLKVCVEEDQNHSFLSVAWYNKYTLWRINSIK